MPHQNVQSSDATAQNAVTENPPPNDQARGQHQSVRPEPRAYAAPDVADATLATPAAGEVADYMDEGEDLGGAAVQQGGTHTRRPIATEAARGQGPKTTEANRAMSRGGSPDASARQS
jgi:hypothetical protein